MSKIYYEQSRNAVKQKHETLKRDKASKDQFINKAFEPISAPLEKLVSLSENHSEPQKEPNIAKREVKREVKSDDSTFDDLNNDYEEYDLVDKTVLANNDNDELLNVSNEEILKTAVDNISTGDNNVDKLFGFRKKVISFLGKTEIFIEDKMRVGDNEFNKTAGLIELLYKKASKDELITSADKSAYRDILNLTNIYRKGNKKNGEIYKYDSNKLKNFDLPLVESAIGGAGILPRSKVARAYHTITEYFYWNDPNELIDRLRLFIAEQSAGNNAHIIECIMHIKRR